MSFRTTTRASATLCMLAFASVMTRARVACAEEPTATTTEVASAPAYTLEVDSDQSNAVSFDTLAPRIAADLGAPVSQASKGVATRAAITIRLHSGELIVRAVHTGGRVLERTVKAEGDDDAIAREAVLLASNLARDEAREILDALSAHEAPPTIITPPPPTPAAPAPPAKRKNADGKTPFTAALVYPVATNWGRPNITTAVDFSLLYSHVGDVNGVQVGAFMVHSSGDVHGLQFGAFGAIAEGSTSGARMSGFGNLAFGKTAGGDIGGATNISLGGHTGARVAGALNLARGDVHGLDISGGANIDTHEFDGFMLAPINVAENVEGVQLGVVNVARNVRGAQLGVINIADKVDGASIGVISITRDGVHPIVWSSNLQYTNVGVKFSTKYFYTITAFTYGTLDTGFGRTVGSTAALGVHVPLIAGLDVEAEAALSNIAPASNTSTKESNTWIAGHVLPGYSIFPHLRIFAGGGVRGPIEIDVGRPVLRPEIQGGVQF